MRVISAADIAEILSFRTAIEVARGALRADYITPPTSDHVIERNDEEPAHLRFSAAWSNFAPYSHPQGYIGAHVSALFPENLGQANPTNIGVFLLYSGHTGAPIAVIDGQALMQWRAASLSGLASSYLSREDASRLLVVGAGALAPFLVEAHLDVRRLDQVLIWNRDSRRSAALASRLRFTGVKVDMTDDLAGAVAGADIVSTATMSATPLIEGDWIKPGTHLDLVGSTLPSTREVDDAVIEQARLFVDQRNVTPDRTGDLALPLATGVMKAEDIAADLSELARGSRAGRRYYDQITLFKSTGTAAVDLALAAHVFQTT